MSSAYGLAVQAADAALGQLLATADTAYGKGNYSLLVTADHGGHAYGHGTSDPQDVTIPWIAWGPGVRVGHKIVAPISTLDTAATALWALGYPPPAGLQGRPVLEAFDPSPAQALAP